MYYQKSKSNSFIVKTEKQIMQSEPQKKKCRYIYATKQKEKKDRTLAQKKIAQPLPLENNYNGQSLTAKSQGVTTFL